MGGTGLETEWKYSSTTIHTYMAGNDYTCLTSLEPRQVGDSLRSPLSFLFFLLNSTTQVFLHTNTPVACVYVRFTTLGPFSMAILRSFNGLLRTSSDIRKKNKKQITTITKHKSMKNLKIMAIMIVIIIATVPWWIHHTPLCGVAARASAAAANRFLLLLPISPPPLLRITVSNAAARRAACLRARVKQLIWI